MKTKSPILLLLLAGALSLAAPQFARAEDFLIKVSLSKGITEEETQPTVHDVVVTTFRLTNSWSVWTRPESPGGPLNPSFQDDLARIYRLNSVQALTENTWSWSGAPGGLGGYVMFGRETFRLEIRPDFMPPAKMKLAITVSRPNRKTRGEDGILNTELVASLDDPVVAGFMAGGRSYFLSVQVTRAARKPAAGESVKGSERAWLPARRVPLVLPENALPGKVDGDVVLQVSVDASGKVTDVRVLKSLQADIDAAATRAVKQWSFDPAAGEKRPEPATFGMSFHFTRRALEPSAEPGEEAELVIPPSAPAPAAGELGSILASCADYCRKLSEAALDLVCEERISEEIYDYRLTYGAGLASDIPSGVTRKVLKNNLLYDFQLVQGPEGIRENRTLLEENGLKKNEKNAELKTRRFFSFRSIYGPVSLFSRDRWPLFDYRIAGRDTISGRRTWVIEVTPKPAVTQSVTFGKAWVDQETRQILKIEVDAKALAGYNKIKEASDLTEARPVLTTIHLYETEKNGLMFPSRTIFWEAYMTPSSRRVQRSKTEITFANYRFFTVAVESSIKQ